MFRFGGSQLDDGPLWVHLGNVDGLGSSLVPVYPPCMGFRAVPKSSPGASDCCAAFLSRPVAHTTLPCAFKTHCLIPPSSAPIRERKRGLEGRVSCSPLCFGSELGDVWRASAAMLGLGPFL